MEPRQVLRQVFGYDDFRGPQAEIVGGLILIMIGAKVLVDHRAFG